MRGRVCGGCYKSNGCRLCECLCSKDGDQQGRKAKSSHREHTAPEVRFSTVRLSTDVCRKPCSFFADFALGSSKRLVSDKFTRKLADDNGCLTNERLGYIDSKMCKNWQRTAVEIPKGSKLLRCSAHGSVGMLHVDWNADVAFDAAVPQVLAFGAKAYQQSQDLQRSGLISFIHSSFVISHGRMSERFVVVKEKNGFARINWCVCAYLSGRAF